MPFPPQIDAVNPASFITVSDLPGADALRIDLIEQIFGSSSLNTSLVPVFHSTFSMAGTSWAGSTNMASIEEWRTTVAKGLISRLYRFKPTVYRNPTTGKGAFILCGGHGDITTMGPYTNMIKWFVASGYEVWTVDMPLSGLNAGAVAVSGPYGGTVNLTSHDTMVCLQTPTFHPFRIFLEPVLSIVNDLHSRGITKIGMAGLSGGGWTTDLYAALDTRILASYSVAGSMPIYARSWCPPHSSLGDWEQQAVANLGVDYLDLYVLASVGTGRYHANIHIVNDPVCFGGDVVNHYAPSVLSVVTGIGGSYGALLDTTVSTHTISSYAASWIQTDTASRF